MSITIDGTEYHESLPGEEARVAAAIASGSIAEAIGGAGAAILALLGLANVLPMSMVCVAVITIGAALLFEGGAIASRLSTVIEKYGEGRPESLEVETGMTTELLGGGAGIVLGVLALVGISPTILLPVAALVFGCSVLLGNGVLPQLSNLASARLHETPHVRPAETVTVAAGGRALAGLATIMLGILALAGYAAMTLTLLALLALGASILFSGTAVGGRMRNVFKH